MSKKNLIVPMVIGMGILVAAPLLVYGRDMGHMRGMGGMKEKFGKQERLYNIPNLTSDQLAKIQKLQLGHQKNVLPLLTQLQTKQLELQTLIIEDADMGKINTKIEEIGKIRTDLQKKQVAHHVAIRKLLTDDQKVYFDARELGHGPGCRGGFGPKCHRGSRR